MRKRLLLILLYIVASHLFDWGPFDVLVKVDAQAALTAQGSEQTISYSPPVANLATNVPATNFNLISPCVGSTCGPGANTFLLTTSPTVTVRLSITNETANACLGSFVISVSASAQASSSFNTQLQQWSTIPLITSANGLTGSISVDLPALSTIYVSSTAISARNVAIQVVNTTGGCASTNVDVTATLTTVSVTSPLISNTNGTFSGGLTANVQGIQPSGSNGSPVFPVSVGGLQPATNANLSTLGIDTTGVSSQAVTNGTSGTNFLTPPTPSQAGETAFVFLGNSHIGTVTTQPGGGWTCIEATCDDSTTPRPATIALAQNSANVLSKSFTNAGANDVFFGDFILFAKSPSVHQHQTGNQTATQVLGVNTLSGSTLVLAIALSIPCAAAPTDTQGLTWRPVLTTLAPGGNGTKCMLVFAAGPTTAAADTVTFNVTSGVASGSSILELSSISAAGLNQPLGPVQLDNNKNLITRTDGGAPYSCIVTLSTNTTTQCQPVPSTTTLRNYVTSISIGTTTAGTTTAISVTQGTGSNCGTGNSALTGNFPNIAIGSFSLSSGPGPLTPLAGNAVCVTQTGTTAGTSTVTISGFVAP